MDVKELRVGNYVDNNVEVFKLEAKDLIFLLAFDNEHYANPIPLTEEWLLKFGGEIKQYSIGIVLDRFRFIWKEEYKYWYVIASDPGGAYMTKIEFVHELQNFFYVMNGKELEIK